MKINKKVFLGSILTVVAIFLSGFFLAAPISCSTKNTWLMIMAGKIHNKIYYPLLQTLGRDSAIFIMWQSSTGHWCALTSEENKDKVTAPQ